MPTIRDVARLAGVSHMTVSRVINDEAGVRPQTRGVVENAIRSLRYSPNPVARALSGSERTTVALLHRFPNSGHLGDFLVHLIDETTKAHAGLVVRKIASPAQDERVVEQLAEDGVGAVILSPPLGDDDRLVAMLRSRNMAVVVAGATRADARVTTVGIDEREAARAVTDHLVSIGHRRIGFIKGHSSHASTQLRLDGYVGALTAAGLAVDEDLIAEGRYDYMSGLDAAERLLDLADPPSAIFASNDDMAAATVAVAHRRGVDVPADLTVCGFDDSTLATTIWPPLTTVRQPVDEVTRVAVDLVLRERSGKLVPVGEQRIMLDHLLVRRQSDAPPRRRPRTAP